MRSRRFFPPTLGFGFRLKIFKAWRSMALILLLLIGTGCNQEPEKKPPPAEQHAESPKEGEEGGEEEGGAETKPVSEMAKLPFQEVEIPARDGLTLYGKLYDPSQKTEGEEEEASAPAGDDEEGGYDGPKYPLIILLHALNGSSRDWDALPAKLVKAGFAVFAEDLRGHGKSDRMKGHKKVSWRHFEPKDWQKMPEDVEQTLEFFEKSEDYPQVNVRRVGLVGASIGANTAIIAAGKGKKKLYQPVQALVLLSPGLDYKGLVTSLSIVQYENATFITASQKDPQSYEPSQTLYRLAGDPKTIRVYKNVGHGTDMLKFQPQLQTEIVNWLCKQMSCSSPLASEPAPAEHPTETAHAPKAAKETAHAAAHQPEHAKEASHPEKHAVSGKKPDGKQEAHERPKPAGHGIHTPGDHE